MGVDCYLAIQGAPSELWLDRLYHFEGIVETGMRHGVKSPKAEVLSAKELRERIIAAPPHQSEEPDWVKCAQYFRDVAVGHLNAVPDETLCCIQHEECLLGETDWSHD